MIAMRELNTNYINNSPNMANSGLNEDPLVSSMSLPLNQLTKRCVIIQKDERGYGLRVSGESPVFVESVREGGAAWRAGVRPGDKIIKVSGTLVTRHHHGEVVRMIQNCGSYVGLTLLGLKTPPTSSNMAPKPVQITGPSPASESTQQAYDETKVVMIKDMIRRQKEYLDKMTAKKNQSEIDKTVKTIQKLEKEIEKMTFDVSRHRHTSMSAENLTTGASNDPAVTNANAKKSHSFGQYDTRAPIMTMESDEENDDFTNNNTNNRRNSSLLMNSKSNYPDVSDIPKTVDALHGHSLQMSRWLLLQNQPTNAVRALLFHTMAGHVFPSLAAQSSMASRKTLQRLGWQIACTWLVPTSPLAFTDFPPDLLSKFDETLLSAQSSLETLFDPFLDKTREMLRKDLEKWRTAANIGLAPQTMPTAKEELQATIEVLLNETTGNLEQTVDTLIAHSHVNNASILALVIALLTIGHYVFACPSKHLLLSQTDSSTCPPTNPVLKLSIDHSSTSNKKHKRAVSCPNRNVSPGHNEAGHHFSATNEITKPIYCSGCLCPIWGTFGLTCAHCQMSVHVWCMKNAAANSPCPGPQSDNQSSETTPAVRPGKKNRRWNSDRYTILDMIKKTVAPNHDSHPSPLISSSTSSSDDDDDTQTFGVTSQPLPSATGETTTANSTTPTPPNTITRSESFRQRRKTVPSYRKRSDPALTTSNSTLAHHSSTGTPDPSVTPDLSGLSLNTSPDHWQISSSEDEDDQSQSEAHNQQSAGTPTTGSVVSHPIIDEDTPPPLPPRPPSEKRKQIYNEILESEERHVEVLKFIHHVFYKPLQKDQLLSVEQLGLVFCNTKKLLKIHKNISRALKAPNKSLEQSLCDIFCGHLGQQLEVEASVFCANQKLGGLDTWRARKKDSRLKNFLDPELRTKGIPDCPLARLSLEDHLGTVFQRPLRYQLLLDRLLHSTPSDSEEYQLIARALARSREIGALVNESTRRAESRQRLSEIARKTDKAQGLILDLEGHTLVHEGALTWRITKQKFVDVLMLLTDRILVILDRDSNDRYTLKYHTNPVAKTNSTNNKPQYSPIVLLHDLFTRDLATDPTAFFLISTDQDVLYEFAAATPQEKKQWKDFISNTSAFNATKPPQHVTKLKDLTSQPSAEEEVKPKDEEPEPDKEVIKTEVEELNTSAMSDDQNNNLSNTAPEETPKEESIESEAQQPPKQSRVEGIIRYVREDECRPPDLIPPTRVTISNEPIISEALAVHSPEQRIAEIDFSVKQLLDEKRNILANMRGIRDQYEWTVVSDLGEHDDVSSAAREVTFFDRAMSLVSSLATDGLSTESYAPLVSLRDQIDALLARLTLDDTQQLDVDPTLYFATSDQSSDETAVYF